MLLLNFQGASSGDLIVITYQLQGNLLVRSNSSTGVTTTIANYVTGFSVEPDPNNANQVQIQYHDRLPLLYGNLYLDRCEPIMIRPLHANPRRGYSLTVVLIFLILLFALWSTVYRTTSSLLRIETNRVLQQTRDQGAMNALAQAIQLLQYSTPSDPTNPESHPIHVRRASDGHRTRSGTCGTSDYTVQFNPVPAQGPDRWQVQVSPGSYSVPLAQPRGHPQWP